MTVNKLKRGNRRKSIFPAVRNIAVLFCIFAVAAIIYLFSHSHPFQAVFPVKHVTFAGNKHLTDDELRILAGVHLNESLVMISSRKVTQQLLKSPWIRSVNLRKEFPDTLSMVIGEAEPFALLEMNQHLFLIDENGKLLEELKDNSIPFLPVITSDPFKEKEGFSEALNLVRTMNGKGFLSERDRIEIVAHKAHELTVTIDGTVVKIGAGGYEEKLEKLIRLEENIKDMGTPVEYIDLRFENKAIVKPVTSKVVK